MIKQRKKRKDVLMRKDQQLVQVLFHQKHTF